MNILNGNEAFAALMAGKNIMCRAANGLIEFDDLDQFPATIFALSGYEFCIKRDTLTLAEIQFTKPAQPHDLESGQEIFIVMPTCILRTQYDSEHGDICLSVANGFAQLDEENAKLQLQAFGKTFGNMITDIEVKDGFNDKPKKRAARSKKVETESVKPTGTESTDLPWHEDDQSKTVVTMETELQLHLDAINLCQSEDEIEATLRDINEVGFNEDQLSQIGLAKSSKLAELQCKALDKIQNNQYQNLLNELLERAESAATPAEANALYKYTTSWSEEQRKPLIDAIHKRLVELNPETSVVAETPSLMVQIQNAADLTTLDALEIDVSARHPDIQPRLMGYVRARRFELENGATP
ncbi:hypothetical protein [Acinetobacter gerneri]|jgi:hypothetical protein|uniref:hypothetical protein n=1 Tax=Acinetobacter gerneri TaxID=202952 RepID=UPI0023F1F43C|nr:hypothetical protein [Acinetobacter gerneri]MCH4245667.1 hypothetical protein [Acinetobacter gerneri]